MSDNAPGPLGPTHLVDINKSLADIKAAKEQAELATRAGIDVTAEIKSLDDSEQKLTQIKQVYFPGQ